MPQRKVTKPKTRRRAAKLTTRISTIHESHFVLPEGRKTRMPKRTPIGIYPASKAFNAKISLNSKTLGGHVVAYKDTRRGPKDRRKKGGTRNPADRKS